jgi:dephospho-CoA kinase
MKKPRPKGPRKNNWAQDRILRCRLKAAFRSQAERRLQAAAWAVEEICPAPGRNLGPEKVSGFDTRPALIEARFMKVFGLTGGLGMGKSAAAQLLGARGVAVVDTDELARRVVEPGQPALEQVLRVFGPGFLAPDGSLRRFELARRVFADPAARKQLEAILHPPIRALWRAQAALWRNQSRPQCVIVIPLLFETGAEAEFDATLCVACSPATQRQRLLARGWTLQEIDQRLRAQWPIEEKMARADYVVWTEGGLDIHAAQLARIGLAGANRDPGL